MNISLRINKSRPNDKGEYPLYVRIRGISLRTGKSQESAIRTGIHIRDVFLRNGDITPRTPNYQSKRRILDSILTDVEKIVGELEQQGEFPHPRLVRKLYDDLVRDRELLTPKPSSFWEVFDEWFGTKKNTSYGYRKDLTNLRKRLKDFEMFTDKQVSFDYIIKKTEVFQSDFQFFLWNERQLSNSYVNKLLKVLSQLMKFAQTNGYIDRKPSFKKNREVETPEKIYLTPQEVLKLYSSTKWDWEVGKDFSNQPNIDTLKIPLEGNRSKSLGKNDPKRRDEVLRVTNWELIKDKMLFLCSTGLRFSDMNDLLIGSFTFDNRDFVLVQNKTKRTVRIPENSISNLVFRKYSKGRSLEQNLFPPLSNQKFNKGLKLLLEDLGFNRLVFKPRMVGTEELNNDPVPIYSVISSHSGRRSFVKNLIDLGTMDYSTIMSITGHRSQSEFQRYISVTDKDTKKSRDLYSLDRKSENIEEELLKRFRTLSDTQKEMLAQLINQFSDK